MSMPEDDTPNTETETVSTSVTDNPYLHESEEDRRIRANAFIRENDS